MCAKLYTNKKYFVSGLVTGTMWDMIMKFISTTSDYSDLKNSIWGNYTNTTLNNLHGQYIAVTRNNGSTSNAIKATENLKTGRYGILTTASSEDVKNKNIYDLAGNLWEWTQEAGWISNNGESYIVRSGGMEWGSTNYPVCCRNCFFVGNASTGFGFRPALFII